ncbi:transketolase family protein [Ruminococcus sp. CLA-AA-H200]|uniref:Transketolase family protein n=1 Tax=Ruminococcus turbiniformis TaxID=2881258 RepID=A0ABS8FSI1_9FIRM|nr:transketolase C-terminal domain-containing protein [Ruminococcus turbiniformis]MCC2252932.1 transketolase family protein [Ruminococcus turbiniformis]
MEMRKIFSQEVEKLMQTNDKICVISADMAGAHDNFWIQDKYPDRAFNIGVCEGNMASVAGGMSAYGMVPFIYTFSSFSGRRMLDQIAISICHPKLNVKIVGSDPGISATILGATHSALDDIGALRSIANLVIFEAVDERQLRQAIPQIAAYDGAVYVRVIRKEAEDIFDDDYKFDLFKADVIREGTDVTLMATGIMVAEALRAVEILKEEGISAELVNVHTIKPIDEETVLASLKKTGCGVTCENHNILGGLHSAVSDVVTEKYPVPLKAIGVHDRFSEVGPLDYLKKLFKLTAEDIAEAAREAVKSKS